MTKIKNNALLKGLSGKMGETHAYRKVRGKMIMVNLPETGRPVPEKVQLRNEKFRKAVDYARGQMDKAEAKALYATGITDKKHNAFLVAVSDHLNAPKVHGIKTVDYEGKVGDAIRIDATDDFKVVRVRVVIRGSDGVKLEQGNASQDERNKHIWNYAATIANPGVSGSTVSATAFDLADNETTFEQVL